MVEVFDSSFGDFCFLSSTSWKRNRRLYLLAKPNVDSKAQIDLHVGARQSITAPKGVSLIKIFF